MKRTRPLPFRADGSYLLIDRKIAAVAFQITVSYLFAIRSSKANRRPDFVFAATVRTSIKHERTEGSRSLQFQAMILQS